MKLTNKYIMFATATLILASCDLDKYPEGQYVSDGQKEETIKDRPNLITAEVNAMAAKLNAFGTISDDASTSHNDYGVPAVSMALESGGQDLVALVTGYNWFNTSQNYSDRVYDSSMDELIWKTFYNHLKAANNVLSLIESCHRRRFFENLSWSSLGCSCIRLFESGSDLSVYICRS